MAPIRRAITLECKIIRAGTNILGVSSSFASTAPQELLILLYQVERLLFDVEQAPPRSIKEALHPAMKALISDPLLKHSDIDVKISVASCMSQLLRISAPDAPYDDVQMKDTFKLIVTALGMLSSNDRCRYNRALIILGNMTIVREYVLMLDLECSELIADMFKVFLSTIRYISASVVFRQMESIMTHILKESEEIPDELMSILLASINRNKEEVLSRPWMLGEKVMINCAFKLQRFLPNIVRSRNLNFDDYSTLVATICVNAPEEDVDYEVESEDLMSFVPR